MTRYRAEEFGAAWNSGNADLVASFFTDDGAYHASVGPEPLGKSYFGKDNIRRGVRAFFDRFPDGKFENLKVVVAGDIGTFEWHFVATDAGGNKLRTAGCDLSQFVRGGDQERVSKTGRIADADFDKDRAATRPPRFALSLYSLPPRSLSRP
jgi:ketosteroid isomerase-like protein